jgi:hypothetical protein
VSREKAIEYLEVVGGREVTVDSLIRNFSIIIPMVPASVWTEFFMGLDYSALINIIADKISENLDDGELDGLIAVAKTPLFQKHLKLYPAIINLMHDDVPLWLKGLGDSGELARLERLMQKAGVDEELAGMIIDSFDYNEGPDYVSNTGTGN